MRQSLEYPLPVAPPIQLGFAFVQRDGTACLAVVGELDLATAETLVATAERAMRAPCRRLRLNLGGVPFCDATGIGALLRIQRQATTAGIALVLEEAQPAVRRVFEIVGLPDLIATDPA